MLHNINKPPYPQIWYPNTPLKNPYKTLESLTPTVYNLNLPYRSELAKRPRPSLRDAFPPILTLSISACYVVCLCGPSLWIGDDRLKRKSGEDYVEALTPRPVTSRGCCLRHPTPMCMTSSSKGEAYAKVALLFMVVNSAFMLSSWDLPRAERVDHALGSMVDTAPLERKITCRTIWGKFPYESQLLG